jgi:PIN domain nuclease of toxin-antitoxin system
MGEVVLDASVLLGFIDPDDALHGSALRAVTAVIDTGHEVVLPASVLADALVGAAREGATVRDDAERRLLDAVDRLHPVDRDVAVHAADVRARHGTVRLPDALVLATGRALDAPVLTADKRWAAVDRRVEVVAG